MWLLKKLTPDFKTIADFRKEHVALFKPVFREFTLLCQELELFGGQLIAIDGSKFKAVNNKDRNFTSAKLQRLIGEIESKITRYLQELESADESDEAQARLSTTPRLNPELLQEKIARLQQRRGCYRALLHTLQESGEAQISLSDPDSRSRPKNQGAGWLQCAGGGGQQAQLDRGAGSDQCRHRSRPTQSPRYSGQRSVGSGELGSAGRSRLLPWRTGQGVCPGRHYPLPATLRNHSLQPTPSRGSGTLWVAKRSSPTTEKFTYNSEHDCYVCPVGRELPFHFETTESNRRIRYYWTYWTTACRTCPSRLQCTRGAEPRRITRWVDEHLLEAMQEPVKAHPEKLQQRKKLVEHPFGTLWHPQALVGTQSLLDARLEESAW